MAILSKDEFLQKIKDYVGDNSDDNTISFIEDMTDTYNDLSSRQNGITQEEVDRRIEEVHSQWRERYKERFFNPQNDPDIIPPKETTGTDTENQTEPESVDPDDLTWEDAFKKNEKGDN